MKSSVSSNEINEAGFSLQYHTIIQILTGIISVALGFIVLIGWHTQNVTLARIQPSFVLMAYNTAVSFVLCGAGLLFVAFGRKRLAIPYGYLADINLFREPNAR